jgi:hypothetical protein
MNSLHLIALPVLITGDRREQVQEQNCFRRARPKRAVGMLNGRAALILINAQEISVRPLQLFAPAELLKDARRGARLRRDLIGQPQGRAIPGHSA